MRWWIPALIIAGTIGYIVWNNAQGVPYRAFFAIIACAVMLLLLAIWYGYFTGLASKPRRRFLLWALIVFVAGFGAFRLLFRYEGSIDGTALPYFVPRWTPEAGEDFGEVPTSPPSDVPEAKTHNDFTNFLGDQRTGVVEGVRLKTDWDAHPPKEIWRQRVGAGWSGFVVSGPYAVTHEQRGERELVTCYALADGKLLWAHENKARFDEKMGGLGPRATPTIDGDLVFAQGATGILDCLELTTGNLRWSRKVLADVGQGNISWGKSNAPLVVDGRVVVTGGGGAPSLIAYDIETGEEAWRAGSSGAGYSSPLVAEVGGVRQILSVNAQNVTGHAIETGKVLWEFSWKSKFPKSSQPIPLGDRVLVTASYGMGSHLLKPGASDVEEIWGRIRMKTKFSSSPVRDGHAYGLDEGYLSCIDVETGDRKWRDGKYGFGQNLLVHDVVLVQAEDGRVVLVKANPEEHVQLAEIEALEGKTWNPPALAAPFLLVRNAKEAVCYELALKEAK